MNEKPDLRSKPHYEDYCLHELFEEQVDRDGEQVAIVCGERKITYSELNRAANQIAHYLRTMGVRQDARVTICMPRSIELMEAVLGVLKAGGAYVPMDPEYPREHLGYLLQDSQPLLVLADARTRELFAGLNLSIPIIDVALTKSSTTQSSTNLDRKSTGTTPGHLAYVIYTSGSTGRSKGVMLEHRSVAARLKTLQQRYGFSPLDRVLQFASITFDASVEEIFGTLLSGSVLVLRNDHWLTGAQEFMRLCEAANITVVDLPTRFWQLITAKPSAKIPECIRLIIIGGEAIDEPALLNWMVREGHRPKLLNTYGPTEASIVASIEDFEREDSTWRSIGKPVEGVQIHILDSEKRPVAFGEKGELYIAGTGLARGYLNRPELTAERFVKDPFVEDPDARMYRTGDIGRVTENGSIEFLGRDDDQVKIRGFRIELGEIEAAIAVHPLVQDAVVTVRQEEKGEKRLVAYYTRRASSTMAGELKEPASPDAEQLRTHLSKMLPEYMVPGGFVVLETLPLTLSGKVDRKRLPAPEYISRVRHRAAETPEEEILCNLFAELLGVAQVGMDDDFFLMGGNSLLVMTLLSRIVDVIGWSLSWQTFSTGLTPATIMEHVQSHPETDDSSLSALPSWCRSMLSRAPLSSAQKRVWFIHRLDPDETAYRFAASIFFHGPLDVQALERALNMIVERHEILRTTFEAENGEPFQHIHPFTPFTILRHGLAATSHSAKRVELEELVQAEVLKKFRLEELPLIRWTLVKLSEREHVLVQVEHHLIHDGWSYNLLLSEFIHAYNYCAGLDDSLKLPPLPFQFSDYAEWEALWLHTPDAQRQWSYWKKKLASASQRIHLLHDHPRNAAISFRGTSIRFEVPLSLCKALRSVSSREGVTLFMAMFAAFAGLLTRYSGQTDILVGSGIANRRHPSSRNIIGMFVNTVILRCDTSGNPTFRELMRQVKEVVMGAFDNQEYPVDQIVENLKPIRVPGMNPLFQTMFSFDDPAFDRSEIKGISIASKDPLSTGGAKVDLNITVIPASDSRKSIYPGVEAHAIELIWEYNSIQFEDETARRMIGHYTRMLEGLAIEPEKRIEDINLLSDEERRRVVHDWNATEREYPRHKCIHELFEDQVEQHPKAIALVAGGQKLTYAELNRRANRLGHYLRELGVGRDVRVGICMERSFEMVEAILGVLKGGGAYVPLDPEYPADRLAFMVADSDPLVILTHTHLRGLLDGIEGARAILDLIASSNAWRDKPESNLKAENVGPLPEHLAYVIYTSGSTGVPKGVMNEHRAVVNRLIWMQSTYGLKSNDAVLQKTPFSFDVSVWEFFWPLLCGAKLVLAQPSGHKDPAYMVETISREKITTIHFVPSMLRLFLDHANETACASLKRVVCSGETLPVALAHHFHRVLPQASLHNLYGPTEAAVDVTAWTCVPNFSNTSVPIGRAISNTQIYILDGNRQPVPIGVTGEIYIGGVQVARGYLNRPELTAERFINDPSIGKGEGRLYKTGDLGRWLADGNIEFLGRNDFQVKIRGFRIELGEIESQIVRYPGVKEAVVTAMENTSLDKQLVAYYTLRNGEEIFPDQLRKYLSAKLPDYMVPSICIEMEAMPLTSNGKIDVRALPAPQADSFQNAPYEAPQGEVEEALAKIWSDLLGLDHIGRHGNFFEMGGHSLLAARMVLRVQQYFEIAASPRDIFEFPTLSSLATEVRKRQMAQFDPGELENIAKLMSAS